jgi:stress response protein YsnF
VEESIRLREEHVSIERNNVDRPATEADFSNFKEGTIELTEHAEKPVVSKTARVVEEVSLEKEVSEREETISDTVRHTEVDAEGITDGEREYENDTATYGTNRTNDNDRTRDRDSKYRNDL